MKNRSRVLTEIERKLSRTWGTAISLDSNWQLEISLDVPQIVSTHGEVDDLIRRSHEWAVWGNQNSVKVHWSTREFNGETFRVVNKLLVPTAQVAAKIVGDRWPARFEKESIQKEILEREFAIPEPQCSLVMRRVRTMSDYDFELLVNVAIWLRDNPNEAANLTPRQVPVTGIHAKWVLSNSTVLEKILGVDGLGLRRDCHRQISFTYLDSTYLKSYGARKHDSCVIGTPMVPAYVPDVVVVSENLDTAIYFPDLPNAISVQGQGHSGADKLVQVDWIASARRILYWGDLDAQGFEILNRYREFGLNVSSVLMDVETLDTHSQMASWFDSQGKPLARVPAKSLPFLNNSERVAYEMITDPSADNVTPIRIEQERIPFDDAYKFVCRVLRR